MYPRNWRHHGPLGAGIAAVVVLLLIAGLLNNSDYRQRGDGRTEQNTKHALGDVKEAELAIVSRQKPPPPNPEPERGEWRQEQDLQAQWQMADWAKYAVLAAIGGVAVTAIGVVFVALTLKATRDAVRETAKATSATERAVEVHVRTEQPLLFVARIMTNAERWQITFDVENIGKTPAILVEWSGQIDALPALPAEPSYPTVIKVRGTVMRPDDDPMQLSLRPPEESAGFIFGEDQATAHFWGYFRYEDVFGKTRKTGFCYVGHPYTGDDGASLNYAHGIIWRRAGGKAYNYDREEEPEA